MSSDSFDPRLRFLSNLEISGCHIKYSTKPVVLLCGGQGETTKNDDKTTSLCEGFGESAKDTSSFKSLRHALIKSGGSPKFMTFRPEDIKNCFSHSIFQNLVEFELELASICSLVVVILESPGSLVELGAFSQLDEMKEKLVAICPSIHRDENSFIHLGILRFMLEKKGGCVNSYPFHESITDELINDVFSDIQEHLDSLEKTEMFRKEKKSHITVLICEILYLFTVLKEGEIIDFLKKLDVVIKPNELKRTLFTLECFEIIKKVNYGDAVFYAKGDIPHHSLIFPEKNGKKINSLAVISECLNFYKENKAFRNWNRAAIAKEKT